jgi:hypothetical protein
MMTTSKGWRPAIERPGKEQENLLGAVGAAKSLPHCGKARDERIALGTFDSVVPAGDG